MTIPTFLPPTPPSPGGTRKPQVNVLRAEFGDGYSQARPKGLRHVRRVVTLRWDALSFAEVEAIEAFLTERAGWQAFAYRPFGFAETVRWTCSDWESEHVPPWRLTATLMEDFSVAK